MARSTYIYVVRSGYAIIGTYTVKHELITWAVTHGLQHHTVTTFKDGNPRYESAFISEKTLQEFVSGKKK